MPPFYSSERVTTASHGSCGKNDGHRSPLSPKVSAIGLKPILQLLDNPHLSAYLAEDLQHAVKLFVGVGGHVTGA